jgi:hypothetical protein
MKTLLVLLLLLAPTLFAQTPTASFTGYVQDHSGAAVKKPKITVQNKATGRGRLTDGAAGTANKSNNELQSREIDCDHQPIWRMRPRMIEL